jgi:[ribosomal protein S5]-alanine N-acetyltransferase
MGEVMILETLHTARLSLRPIEFRDLENLFLLRSDESSSNFNDSVPDRSEAETLIHLTQMIKDIQEGQYWKWAIDLDGALVGTIALWNYDQLLDSAEFGYTLRSPFRGKGYMSESVAKILDYGHHRLGIKNLYVYTESCNERSIKMMDRLAFVYQGSIDEEGLHKIKTFHYNVYLHTEPDSQ